MSNSFDADVVTSLEIGAVAEVQAGFGERRVVFMRSPSGWIFEIVEINGTWCPKSRLRRNFNYGLPRFHSLNYKRLTKLSDAELFLWLCGKHNSFQNWGGRARFFRRIALTFGMVFLMNSTSSCASAKLR